MEKEKRKEFHAMVKNFMPSYVSSCENGLMQIEYRKDGYKANLRESFGNIKILQFTLFKTNRDTLQAVQEISRKLHVSTKNISFAGTKDRRGVTTQIMTASGMGMQASRFKICNNPPFLQFGNFKEVKEHIRLGQLKGNEFEVVIRNVVGASDDIKLAAASIVNKGFVNYFGLQRFGNSNISTHRIGRALFRGEYLLAVYLILGPRGQENGDIAAARQHLFETGDIDQALRDFPV